MNKKYPNWPKCPKCHKNDFVEVVETWSGSTIEWMPWTDQDNGNLDPGGDAVKVSGLCHSCHHWWRMTPTRMCAGTARRCICCGGCSDDGITTACRAFYSLPLGVVLSPARAVAGGDGVSERQSTDGENRAGEGATSPGVIIKINEK
jgi:hypothetical protein